MATGTASPAMAQRPATCIVCIVSMAGCTRGPARRPHVACRPHFCVICLASASELGSCKIIILWGVFSRPASAGVAHSALRHGIRTFTHAHPASTSRFPAACAAPPCIGPACDTSPVRRARVVSLCAEASPLPHMRRLRVRLSCAVVLRARFEPQRRAA